MTEFYNLKKAFKLPPDHSVFSKSFCTVTTFPGNKKKNVSTEEFVACGLRSSAYDAAAMVVTPRRFEATLCFIIQGSRYTM